MIDCLTTITTIGTAILAYYLAQKLYKRFDTLLLLPVATVSLAGILILITFNVPYEAFMQKAWPLDYLLGPAVVALAYPLYINRQLVKRELLPLLGGILAGAIVGILTGTLLAAGLGFEANMILSILPKSVTTPVAVDISNAISGTPSISVVFVMTAGIFGSIVSRAVFKYMRVDSPIGRGVALGSASHAIGTARALEVSQKDGAFSTIAMILSALAVSFLAPLVALLI